MRIAGEPLKCSFNNGHGARYVIFVQGCAHHCKGCQNPDTWDFNGGVEMDVEEISRDYIAECNKKHGLLDGITLSGGDPFYQQSECLKLMQLLPLDNFWIYTGFEWNEIRDTELAKAADAVVTGPFIEELKCEGKCYGSLNQEVHFKGEKI